MKNRLLKFDEFKNGNTLVEPKKHALAVKPADPVKKEKTIDQVKKADLTPLDTNEPDYSKTVKVDESTASLTIQVEIDKLNAELKKLDPKAVDYDSKKLDLDTKLLAFSKQMDAQKVTDAAPKAV
jgi:hypothetical protein